VVFAKLLRQLGAVHPGHRYDEKGDLRALLARDRVALTTRERLDDLARARPRHGGAPMRSGMRCSTIVFAAATLLGFIARSAMANGPQASGHGNLTTGGELRTFSFTAITQSDGSVTGEAELKSRASGTVIHAHLDCLTVVGNQAYIGGIVTKATNPAFVGKPAVFTVIDHGEGASAPPDELSLFVTFVNPPSEDCNGPTNHSQTMHPIEAGNIQVNP
jgi:hypothetical protein